MSDPAFFEQSGAPEKALRLIAAADFLRKTIGAKFSENERKKIDRVLSASQGALAEDEASSAWERGVDSTLAETIKFALELNGT